MSSRNTQALRSLAITAAALTYAAAVIYGDVMFLSVVAETFPAGILGNLAIAGAITTAISALALPIALHWWLAPGLQFVTGILYWLVDVAALGLNSILAYALATGTTDTWLASWQTLTPATPLLAVLGWGLLFLLDPSHQLAHAQAELRADQVEIYSQRLRDAARSDVVTSTIHAGAQLAAAAIASQLTGVEVPAGNLAPALAGRASAPAASDPANLPLAPVTAPKAANGSTPPAG